MKRRDVFLLGGTSESRQAADALSARGVSVVASVVSPRAVALYRGLSRVDVVAGRLPPEQLREAVRAWGVSVVVDATHPFAESISRSAIQVCGDVGVPYVRWEREDLCGEDQPGVSLHADVEALWAQNVLRGRRVLLTVGTMRLREWRLRAEGADLYVRVMTRPESVARARAAGFPDDRVVALDPPVPEETERALWRDLRLDAIVAKASGRPGGEDVKRRVAASLGVHLHLLQRPQIAYPAVVGSCEELLRWLEEHL